MFDRNRRIVALPSSLVTRSWEIRIASVKALIEAARSRLEYCTKAMVFRLSTYSRIHSAFWLSLSASALVMATVSSARASASARFSDTSSA